MLAAFVYCSPLTITLCEDVTSPAPHRALLPQIAVAPHNALLASGLLEALHTASAPQRALLPDRTELPQVVPAPHKALFDETEFAPHKALSENTEVGSNESSTSPVVLS